MFSLALLLAAQNPGGFTIQQGDSALTLGSELRFRHETRDPVPPLTGAGSSSGSSGRFRLSVDGKLGGDLRAFLEFESVVATDGLDSDEMLHQAFAEMLGVGGMADVQVGRFNMLYGDELLISPGEWGKTGNAWDGLRVRHKDEHFWADLFVTQPVEAQTVPVGVDQSFGGVYLGVPAGDFAFEAYGLLRDDRHDAGALADDATVGGRAMWKPKDGPSVTLELAAQTGDHGALDAGGTMAMVDAAVPAAEGLRLGLNFLYASGDGDPADSDDDAFKPLYHTPHKILGASDLVQLTNVQDVSAYARWKASESWRFLAAVHWMTLAETDGALPDLRGGMVKAPGEDDLGISVDAMAWYAVNRFAEIHFGLTDFLAGDAIAGGDDQLWAFAQLLVRL